MITSAQLEIIRDALILENSKRLMQKLSLEFEPRTRSVRIIFWDFDEEDFKALQTMPDTSSK